MSQNKQSLDSEKPILHDTSNRASMRFSTYSKAPSDAPTYTTQATDPEIREYEQSVQRMEDRRTQDQRYSMTQTKMDEMEKLAVLGKVEKSLQRRYHNQDAVMRPPGERRNAAASNEKLP